VQEQVPIIGFSGPSGIGKTTLLEAIVSILEAWKLRVGVVKHSSHAVPVDVPGKDSHRLFESGAHAVALAMPGQVSVFAGRPPDSARLVDALEAVPDGLDVILVEGFLWEPIPRYVLLPPDGDDERGYTTAPGLLRVLAAPSAVDGEPPAFPRVLVVEIAGEIIEQVQRRSVGREPRSLASRSS
jgi:molybdopterin-guanine dinucleotide biosynthesis protein MobB